MPLVFAGAFINLMYHSAVAQECIAIPSTHAEFSEVYILADKHPKPGKDIDVYVASKTHLIASAISSYKDTSDKFPMTLGSIDIQLVIDELGNLVIVDVLRPTFPVELKEIIIDKFIDKTKWSPAICRSRNVPFEYRITLYFRLRDDCAH